MQIGVVNSPDFPAILVPQFRAEDTLYIENSPLGVFKPRKFIINLDNMVAGDTVVIREYYRIKSGGNLELMDYVQYNGADGGLLNNRKIVEIDLTDNRFGFQITLEEIVGALHDYDWELFEEA